MDKFLFSSCQDNNIYFINIKKLKDLEWERNKMNEEDAFSAAMLEELGKKKGKGKGKGNKVKGNDKKEINHVLLIIKKLQLEKMKFYKENL